MRLLIVVAVLSLTQVGITNLTDLTLPLPSPCQLTPAPFVRDSDRIRAGLWGNLAINSNPWVGTDRAVLIDLYERLFDLVGVPDTPIFNRQELANFRNTLADGIVEGYAAFYDTNEVRTIGTEAVPERITVLAVTMRTTFAPIRSHPTILGFTFGQTFGMVVGKSGDCRESLVTHITGIGAVVRQ